MMRSIIIILLTFSCSQIYGQDVIIKKIVHIRELTNSARQSDSSLALAELQEIEQHYCIDSFNDTIKGVFLELKGQALHNLEKHLESIKCNREAIEIFEKCNLRQYEYLDAFRNIAISYHRLKDYENAERYYRKGLLRSVAANVSTRDQYLAVMYLNLGNLYKSQGEFVLSEACFSRSRRFQEDKPLDIDEWNYVEWESEYWDKIDAKVKLEKYQDAVDLYSEMIDGILKKRGKDHNYILPAYSKAILLCRHLGKFEEALSLFQDVIECASKLSISDESVCGAYDNVALCYSYLGDYAQLDAFIPKAKDFLFRAQNKDYPPHSVYRFAGNGAYWRQDYEKSIIYFEQYISSENPRESGSIYDEIINMLSVSYILSSNSHKGNLLLSNFLNSNENRLKKENRPLLAYIYHNLGRANMLDDSLSEAIKFLQKSKALQLELYGDVSERTQQYINECNSK